MKNEATEMNETTIRSADLRPGMRLRYRDGTVVTLARRKSPSDLLPETRRGMERLPYHSGWWLRDGGGLADFVLDADESDWTILEDRRGAVLPQPQNASENESTKEVGT